MDTTPAALQPKLVTRQAMKDFEAAGIKVLDSSYGNKNVFHLAKYYPALLTELLERTRSAEGREKEVWNHLLGNEMWFNPGRPIPDRTQENYRKWLDLLPFVTDLMWDERESGFKKQHYGRHLVFLIDRLVQSIIQVLRNGNDSYRPEDDSYKKVKAILAVITIDKAAGGKGAINGKDEDIAFFEENLDVIEPLARDLLERGTSDRGIVQSMLTSPSSALNSGLL